MVADCKSQVLEQLKKINDSLGDDFQITKKEASAIVEQLEQLRDSVNGNSSEFLKKSQKMLQDWRSHRASERLASLQTAKKEVEADRLLVGAKDPVERIRGLLVGTFVQDEGARQSVDALFKGNTQLLNRFISNLKSRSTKTGNSKETLYQVLAKGHQDADILEVMHRQANGQTLEGLSNEAIQIGQAVKQLNDSIYKLLVDSGVPVKYRADYIMRQVHDYDKIRKVGKQEWTNKIFNKLDREKSFGQKSDSEIVTALGGMYDDIVSGKDAVILDGDATSLDPFGPAAKGFQRARELIFKDGNSLFDYNKEFGIGSVADSIGSTAIYSARWAAVTAKMGTNPRAFLNRLMDKNGIKEGTSQRSSLVAAFNEVTGQTRVPYEGVVAKQIANIRVLTSMALLGNAALRSLPDISTLANNLQLETGQGFFSAHATAVTEVLSAFKGARKQQAAELAGVMVQSIQGNIAQKIGLHEPFSRNISKAADTYFKLNFLDQWTSAVKAGQTMALVRHLGMNADNQFSKLHPNTQRGLTAAGIDEELWNIVRQGTAEVDGKTLIALESIEELDIPDADKFRATQALTAYFADQADIASPTPGSRERATLFRGLPADDPINVIVGMGAQFLSFPLTIATKNLKKNILAGGADSVTQGLQDGSTIAKLAQMGISMTAMAYMGDSLIELSKGKTPKVPDSPEQLAKLTWDMFLKGGAGSIYADIIGNAFEGRGILPTSPLERQAGDIATITRKAFQGDVDSRRILRSTMNLTPGQNLFWLRGALDYAFLYNLQEATNPGYLKRVENRAKEFNQEFIAPRPTTRRRGGPFR